MNRKELAGQIRDKESFLCVGLDTDIKKIPVHLLKEKDPVFEFNRRIIDATEKYCIAYKPNLAFYEALGPQGLESLQRTIEYIPDHIFTIADAKRGDIGNTSKLYARAFFEYFNFDSVTVAPYMGEDSVTPFLEFPGKWVILLALTSNQGSQDFQTLTCSMDGELLYEHVISTSRRWASPDQLMFVIGATQSHKIQIIREQAQENFFLVPGIGAQGGDLESVCQHGFNKDVGLIVNSSRGIIYADDSTNFAEAAGKKAAELQQEMASLMDKYLP
ncbi:orotidine-5'-phosphate decarboxylase [Fulvivirga sedimenti]|uniref:Orotidine-5'-phosphate decarboxylase n=1 Tax=Fulvivirga sedimenti TaxID=2879465 RepID=A0A9X1HKN0_9BACT|nr:orotidine-5'-phosphate decarboxylase [Fulvivirga sedimenti]MCA6074004.1 orotidine-5'-phosphate decarboxylase [Fulvivirga sedimenti]